MPEAAALTQGVSKEAMVYLRNEYGPSRGSCSSSNNISHSASSSVATLPLA